MEHKSFSLNKKTKRKKEKTWRVLLQVLIELIDRQKPSPTIAQILNKLSLCHLGKS